MSPRREFLSTLAASPFVQDLRGDRHRQRRQFMTARPRSLGHRSLHYACRDKPVCDAQDKISRKAGKAQSSHFDGVAS